MGTLLWSPNWVTPPTFAFTRAYADIFALGWAHGVILEDGPRWEFKEDVYGGYGLVIKLYDYVYEFSHKTFLLQDIFEDVYAYAPGSSVPIHCGTPYVDVRHYEPYGHYGLVIGFDLPNLYVHLSGLGPTPDSYWSKDRTPIPALPASYYASDPPPA